MDNFDMNKYFDDFFAAHTNAGESIDDIMAAFANAANRVLTAKKAAEEEKRKAEEAEKLAALKKEQKRKNFEDVMDTMMEFLLDYDYITDDEYDKFWKDWDDEFCDELLNSLDEIKNWSKKFSDDLDFLEDLIDSLGIPAAKEDEDKNNIQPSKPVDKTDAQPSVQKNPIIKVKLPHAENFFDLLNEFLGK